MSIIPIAFNNETKIYTMLHDDHEFEVALSELAYNLNPDSTTNWTTVTVPCPLDDSVSWHPAGGGAAPIQVQEMFSQVIGLNGCPCGTLSTLTRGVALSHAKLHCAQMDGAGRWQVPENSGQIEEILFDAATHYVVGLGPFTEEPPPVYSAVGVDEILVAAVLANVYTKFEDGAVVRAEKP
jgi:hypothetical protein